MTFEYIIKWALLNGFEAKFRKEPKSTYSLGRLEVTFSYYHEGQSRHVRISEIGYNDFFSHIEYDMPRIIEQLKHIKPEEKGIVTREKKTKAQREIEKLVKKAEGR